MSLTAWFGPVASYQVPGAQAEGSASVFIQCNGKSSQTVPPYCSDEASKLLDADGRYVPKLAAKAGLNAGNVGDVFVGSFSAGHGIVRPMLMNDRDRAAVRAVVLADSTYMSASRVPPEGYVRFALDCLAGDKMLIAIATNIPGAPGLPSGSDTLEAMRSEIEARSGRSFELGGALPVDKQPGRLMRLGGIILADYGSTSTHGGTAGLAASYWKGVLNPWARSPKAPPSPIAAACPDGMTGAYPDCVAPGDAATSWPWLALSAAGAAAVGYVGARWAMRKMGWS